MDVPSLLVALTAVRHGVEPKVPDHPRLLVGVIPICVPVIARFGLITMRMSGRIKTPAAASFIGHRVLARIGILGSVDGHLAMAGRIDGTCGAE